MAFDTLKAQLCSAPVLIRPNFSKRFLVYTDASNDAIGCVLSQEVDTVEHPIVYLNRLLTASERRWTMTEKECIAVLWSVEKLIPYVKGYAFTVFTDHASLTYLKNLKDPKGRLSRWAMKLSAYDIIN